MNPELTRAEDTKPKLQSTGRNDFRLFHVEGSPYLQVRFMVNGKRRQFSTGAKSPRAAAAKARVILADILSQGFNQTVSLHSRKKDVLGPNPTIEELADKFSILARTFDPAPGDASIRAYVGSFKLMARFAGAKRLSALTAAGIEAGKRAYLANAASKGRNPESAKITLATVLRNASALFSKQALSAYRHEGLEFANPFEFSKVRGTKIKPYTPLERDLLADIWRKSKWLRDGDHKAAPPTPSMPFRQRIDFRKGHPDAYAILILELGLGLRRNEADKALWSWCIEGADGRRFLQVQSTTIFTPKSRQSRIVPIAPEIWDALQAIRQKGDPFIVPGRDPLPNENPRCSYRCEIGHRVLVEWLHRAGVSDPKPCHALRKEFGSYIATSFSLFHAQRFLGHSTPMVTSSYYAGLTDLPEISPTGMPVRSTNRGKRREFVHRTSRRQKVLGDPPNRRGSP